MSEIKTGQIILITGVMAAGKSTVAELVARALPKSVHLRGDVFRKMIVNGRLEMSGEGNAAALDQLRLRYELSAIAAKRYADAGFDVVYQDVIIGPILSDVVALYTDYEMSAFVLAPRADEIVKRERARQKTGYHSVSVEQLYAVFSDHTPRLGKWIDSSGQSPEDTANVILEAVRG